MSALHIWLLFWLKSLVRSMCWPRNTPTTVVSNDYFIMIDNIPLPLYASNRRRHATAKKEIQLLASYDLRIITGLLPKTAVLSEKSGLSCIYQPVSCSECCFAMARVDIASKFSHSLLLKTQKSRGMFHSPKHM